MTIRGKGLLDLDIKGSAEALTPDNTLGLVTTHDPERFPKSLLVDPERLERALIAVREEFDNPTSINIAVVRGEEDCDPDIALYPDGERDRAVVVASRYRPPEDQKSPEDYEVEVVDDGGGDSA